ncbi:MAG: glycosyltransferase family 4 protein [Chloroherpetonaceae bacterium]|nr:glycosyltransferase family 4 protein [Chloroherpetonaceae bacterium]
MGDFKEVKVIVSNVGKHHAYETAHALEKAGLLRKIYTSFYDKAQLGQFQKLIKRFIPTSLLKKISNRKHPSLNEAHVVSYFFPELIYRIPPFVKLFGRYQIMNLVSDLFDRRVAFQLQECSVFHGFESCVEHTMKRAKSLGAITVLDQPIFHHMTIREILTEEYAAYGLQPPIYARKDDWNIRRKRREISLADYLFVPTEFIKADFARRGFDASKIFVIPYGFNPKRFQQQPNTDNTFRVICVGIIGFRKGMLYLLEAFKKLNLPNAELLLVSPIDEEFKPVLAKYEGHFRHIHSIPNEKLSEYYANSTVFCLPSLIEGSALVTYEAMGSGLPLIVTPNTGSVMRDGQDGFQVPIRSVESLMEKIEFFYQNPLRAKEMGQSAYQYIQSFTWERYHERVQEAYQQIIKRENL